MNGVEMSQAVESLDRALRPWQHGIERDSRIMLRKLTEMERKVADLEADVHVCFPEAQATADFWKGRSEAAEALLREIQKSLSSQLGPATACRVCQVWTERLRDYLDGEW